MSSTEETLTVSQNDSELPESTARIVLSCFMLVIAVVLCIIVFYFGFGINGSVLAAQFTLFAFGLTLFILQIAWFAVGF